ncbi:hypothetical protein PCH_Pc21g08550 [Penicillium rubens Wisconsin 54-1255]|uniref:Uncharacterized protein n=1 Tax=Penicillium rubens (strain ATCC 28089 / DSM 1075 / NRRL 1951 / Wisconsin 54-1255) TaxID=500485 RepID=B6HLZ7_PENRW|nr:hypothetical protein PCH_Pc21g08550 [Penicillium rubens Wisconsin 54-1255]
MEDEEEEEEEEEEDGQRKESEAFSRTSLMPNGVLVDITFLPSQKYDGEGTTMRESLGGSVVRTEANRCPSRKVTKTQTPCLNNIPPQHLRKILQATSRGEREGEREFPDSQMALDTAPETWVEP